MVLNRRRWCGVALAAVVLPAPAQDQPAVVVQRLLDAMAARDAVRIRAAFSPGASQAYGDAAPKSGKAFDEWLRSDIIDSQGRVDAPELSADGTRVVVKGRYSNNRGYRAPADFLFEVQDGRIVVWRMRY